MNECDRDQVVLSPCSRWIPRICKSCACSCCLWPFGDFVFLLSGSPRYLILLFLSVLCPFCAFRNIHHAILPAWSHSKRNETPAVISVQQSAKICVYSGNWIIVMQCLLQRPPRCQNVDCLGLASLLPLTFYGHISDFFWRSVMISRRSDCLVRVCGWCVWRRLCSLDSSHVCWSWDPLCHCLGCGDAPSISSRNQNVSARSVGRQCDNRTWATACSAKTGKQWHNVKTRSWARTQTRNFGYVLSGLTPKGGAFMLHIAETADGWRK